MFRYHPWIPTFLYKDEASKSKSQSRELPHLAQPDLVKAEKQHYAIPQMTADLCFFEASMRAVKGARSKV